MRIHFVAPIDEDWILRRIAKSFQRNILGSSISDIPDYSADVNVYVNAQLFRHHTACDIGFFTHREHDGPEASRFDELAEAMDGCIAMCTRTAALLPPEKTTIIQVGPDNCFSKKAIVLGIVGREYASGRKRYDWIADLRAIPGIEVRFTNGKIPWRKMPGFYRKIDYLLILSDNEGGPIPLLEALRMGVPVISSNVGFVPEFSSLRYNTKEELLDLVRRLTVPEDIWKTASAKLVDFASSLPVPKRDVESLRIQYGIDDTVLRRIIRWARWNIPTPVWKLARSIASVGH